LSASLALAAPLGWAQHAVTVPFEVESVSNPGLDPDERGSVTLFRIAPRYEIESQSDTYRSVLSLGATVERSNNTSLSANRSHPDVGYTWESNTPTSVLRLGASYSQASTRSSEFAEFGRVSVDSTQETGVLNASWSRELTPQTRLITEGTFNRVSYDAPLLEDYHEAVASLALERDLGDRETVSLGTSVGRLVPDGGSPSDSRVGLLLGYERALSEALTLTAELGAMQVRPTGAPSQTDPVGRLQLAYTGERITSSFGWMRSVSAGGTIGGYLRTQELNGSLGYALTEGTSLSLGASRAQTLAPENTVGTSVSARMRSELSPYWSMTFGIERRRLEAADGRTASSNLYGVGLVYAHPNF
jgi:hypothetical protein